jgi:hypothetical protein
MRRNAVRRARDVPQADLADDCLRLRNVDDQGSSGYASSVKPTHCVVKERRSRLRECSGMSHESRPMLSSWALGCPSVRGRLSSLFPARALTMTWAMSTVRLAHLVGNPPRLVGQGLLLSAR